MNSTTSSPDLTRIGTGALAPAIAGSGPIPTVLLVLGGTLLLTLSAKISVPFWPVPMTLQTLAVMLIGASYGSWLGAATVLAYLAEGLVGIPVFANTPPAVAGPAYFLGTTGGFLIGFVPCAFIVGWFAERARYRTPVRLAAAMVAGDAIVFALGFVWLAWFAELSSGANGIGAQSAWVNGVANFLLADGLKIAIAALLVPAGWALLQRRRG